MQTTLDLLARATQTKTIPEWTTQLGLSKKALYTAKDRGHLTPVMAGLIALELGEDAPTWIQTAVIEGEKDSPSKRLLERRLKGLKRKITSLYFALGLGRHRPLPSAR